MSDAADRVHPETQHEATTERSALTPIAAGGHVGGLDGGVATTALLRRMAQRSRGPAESIGAGGRIERSDVAHDDPGTTSRSGGVASRVQRSPNTQSSADSAPMVPRIQPMASSDMVQRDFSDMASAVGSGIASGAKAVGNAVASGAKAVGNAAVSVAQAIHRSDFNDLNSTQYLVTGQDSIEAINRRVDENGTVVYYKTGSVTRGDGDRPTIVPYDEAIPVPPGWLPSITHINGMMVKPNEGLGSALRLQQELHKAGGNALLEDDIPSVLYTYSAHRGFVTDLAECVWGKLYQDDDATDRQTQIMLDAVANQHRTTVSAHSRGTIKTDNAVRNAHAKISQDHVPAASEDPGVHQRAADAARAAALDAGPTAQLSANMLESVYRRLLARQHADELATAELDKYVQLIYAGNAVQFPSSSVNLNLVVAGSDPITILVGKYFGFAAGSKTDMTDIDGGHGFDDNYASTVAGLIIADLEAQQ